MSEESETGVLFLYLHQTNPEFAMRCYNDAEGGLVALRKYDVCSTYIAQPLENFERIRELHQVLLKQAKKCQDPDQTVRRQESADTHFESEVFRLLDILMAALRTAEADEVWKLAFAELGRPPVRSRSC